MIFVCFLFCSAARTEPFGTNAELDPIDEDCPCFLSERKFLFHRLTSRYAILLEFMDEEVVAHFIKCFRVVHDTSVHQSSGSDTSSMNSSN